MPRMLRSFMKRPALAAEGAGGELAVEVPQGQAVRLDLEVGVAALAVLERVGVGHHVAAHPVGVDQLEDPGLLDDVVVVEVAMSLGPADRLVGDPQRAEDLVVEAVLAEQQLVHAAQELARLRALDDAVVVGRGQRHDLADRVAGRSPPRRRPATPAGYSIAPTPMIAPWPAISRGTEWHGADAAGVGQRDRGALEVGDGELVVARLAHDLLVGGPEAGEVHRLGGLDARHEQLAGAVGLRHVDREAEVDVGRRDQVGLAVDDLEADVHLRASSCSALTSA